MFLRTIALSQFRNIACVTIACPDGLSVLVGENAQGKSNFLEAVYFISTGRSFRTSRLAEVVRWGQEQMNLISQVVWSGVEHRISACIGLGASKYNLDGKPRRASDVFGHFKAVIFASEDLDVVRQDPAKRRKFFDLFFCLVDGHYAKHLEDYAKVVKSRNLLLKAERYAQMDAWNELLIREGSWIAWQRMQRLAQFQLVVQTQHAWLSGGAEDLAVSYRSSCEGDTCEAVAEALGRKLQEHQGHERILKTTLVGPHRDDYGITIGGHDIRHFGSEGQKRSAMLSMRMAQWTFLKEISGEPPMILLDDVLGELDRERQAAFLDLVVASKAQIFLAVTGMTDFLKKMAQAVYPVHQGAIGQVAGV